MTQYSKSEFSMIIADFSQFCSETISMIILFQKQKQKKKKTTELRKTELRNGIKLIQKEEF